MRDKLKIGVVAIAAVAAGLFAAWKLVPDRRTAEEQILDSLVQIQKAVQEKDLRGTMRHVSEAYGDPTVESKRELVQLTVGAYRQPGGFQVTLQAGRPEVQGTQASVDVRVEFTVVEGPAARRVPPFTVQTRWAREKAGWKIVRAEGYWEGQKAFEEVGW